MSKRTDIRRLAMQALYQLDLRGEQDRDAILDALCEDADDAALGTEAFKLAEAAWQLHDQTDALATQLAPDWPTYRQPPLDRAILRLSYYEITSERAPVKVAINEAVELAKAFCAEHSPAFINGVLDKMARGEKGDAFEEGEAEEKPLSPEAWLADAVKDAGESPK
ncbi:MAG: transcription antitermination factor NusB [Phycisphaeraceae bacterium]